MIYVERFNRMDENCIPLSIDRVSLHLRGSLYHREEISNIKNVKKTIEFWANRSLLEGGFYHPIFCFNPHYIRLFYKYRFRPISCLISSNFIALNSAYMFFACGNDLYGIPEFWNHMVVELFGKTEKDRTYYDSYLNVVKNDYPNLLIRELTHQELMRKMAICLIIRG